MRLISVLLLLCSSVVAGDYSNADGAPFAKREGKTREPIVVVDSVQMSGGFGTLTLNLISNRSRRTTNPSDVKNLFAYFTQRSVDTTATPARYSYTVLRDGQKQITGIRVVSSQADDSARVDVHLIIK